MNIKALLIIGGFTAVIAFGAGWKVKAAFVDAAQTRQTRIALANQAAKYESILQDVQHLAFESERESAALRDKLRTREQEAESLREEIRNADYKAQGDGDCPRHPINDPRWLRDRTRAAELPGTAEADNPG